MGTDAVWVLGKLKTSRSLPAPTTQALDVIGFSGDADFEFQEVSEHPMASIRHYGLFDWLSGIREEVAEPLLEESKIEQLYEATEEFVEYCDSVLGTTLDKLLYPSFRSRRLLYFLPQLTSFNYDQPVVIRKVSPYTPRVNQAVGKTYREYFPQEWFDFLNHSSAQGWEFVIVGFDSY